MPELRSFVDVYDDRAAGLVLFLLFVSEDPQIDPVTVPLRVGGKRIRVPACYTQDAIERSVV